MPFETSGKVVWCCVCWEQVMDCLVVVMMSGVMLVDAGRVMQSLITGWGHNTACQQHCCHSSLSSPSSLQHSPSLPALPVPVVVELSARCREDPMLFVTVPEDTQETPSYNVIPFHHHHLDQEVAVDVALVVQVWIKFYLMNFRKASIIDNGNGCTQDLM